MPAYGTDTNPSNNIQTGAPGAPYVPIFTPGVPLTLWNQADVPVGNSSQQFAMHRHEKFATCIAAEIAFSADPGAFQIDFQTADTDEDACYVTKYSLLSTDSPLNASFNGRMEMSGVVAKFGRFQVVALANAIAVTITVS